MCGHPVLFILLLGPSLTLGGQPSQFTAGEQGVERGRDIGRLFPCACQADFLCPQSSVFRPHRGHPAGRHSSSADGRDVVTAGLAVIGAVDARGRVYR